MPLKKFGYVNGVSAQQLWRIERHEVEPPEHFIRLMCLQFSVNRRWLEQGIGKITESEEVKGLIKAEKLKAKKPIDKPAKDSA